VTTIDNGTIIGIARPGIYRVNFALSQAAATTVNVAVSLNATNVAAEPVAGVAGILAAVLQTNVAAQVTGVYLTYDVPVTAASIRTTPGGRALLRLHCTNGAGAAGGAGITAATAQVQIRRMIGLAA
jgi:hypothetical protein